MRNNLPPAWDLTAEAQDALDLARARGDAEVHPEHLLLADLRRDGPVHQAARTAGAPAEDVEALLRRRLDALAGGEAAAGEPRFSPRLKGLLRALPARPTWGRLV